MKQEEIEPFPMATPTNVASPTDDTKKTGLDLKNGAIRIS